MNKVLGSVVAVGLAITLVGCGISTTPNSELKVRGAGSTCLHSEIGDIARSPGTNPVLLTCDDLDGETVPRWYMGL